MKNQDFATYFRRYKTAFQDSILISLTEAAPGTLDEAAFPAYTHSNPIINWFFWQRIFVVMKFIKKNAPYNKVMDFGCGSGVLLPFLAENSVSVTGADLDLLPLEHIKQHTRFPPNLDILDLARLPLKDIPSNSYDLITALDVLEHVDDLSSVVDELLRILKPEGKLIVSGPTENWLYQIGRKIAGKIYSGGYHKRGVSEIQKMAGQKGIVKTIAILYPPIPLFSIFTVSPD